MTIKLLTLSLIASASLWVHSTQGTIPQDLYSTNNELETLLYAPISVDTNGIRSYLQQVYNRREYVDVLSNNFSHVSQFLYYGKTTHQTHAYVKSILKLFSNKLKATPYVNAYAFTQLLEELPALLTEHFTTKRSLSLDPYKEKVNSILYSTFFSRYDNFKQDPQAFFNDLSLEIVETLQECPTYLSDDISKDELRQAIVRFLDLAISKLIWNAQECENIWDNFKTIVYDLEKLMEHHIINDLDDVDDLLWTLIHRFCFFLDIVRPELPSSFYETIKNDLTSQQLALLTIEEQEPLIEPKDMYLLQIIIENLAKKQAVEQGLIIS